MNQIELLQKIATYLARFKEQVEILNSNGEFSINIHAENLLVKLLNVLYDLELENLNKSEAQNYASIDLRDDKKGMAFQVTATSGIGKIKETIEKYFRNEIFRKSSILNIFIITGKQRSYSEKSISDKVEQEIKFLIETGKIKQRSEIFFNFNANVNVLDNKNIYNDLYKLNNMDKIISIEKILREQFDKIDEQKNLTKYYKKQKNSFYDIVMDDEKGLTLNKLYVDPAFNIFYNSLKSGDERIQKINFF